MALQCIPFYERSLICTSSWAKIGTNLGLVQLLLLINSPSRCHLQILFRAIEFASLDLTIYCIQNELEVMVGVR
jgi:hypothetical protein